MANEEWTDDELRASVHSYLEMFGRYRAGEEFVRKDYYRVLAAQFPRTEKASVTLHQLDTQSARGCATYLARETARLSPSDSAIY
jgi:hypothetical protein